MEISSELHQKSDLHKEKILSAKELFRWRRRDNIIVPQRGGVKDFEPDNSWLQAKRLEGFYDEELSVLGEPRVEKSGNLVQGFWDENLCLVNIEKTAKFWMKMGFAEHNRNWLHPEEALFLMEVNCLVVQNHGLYLSLQEAYEVFLAPKTTLSLEEYQVYAHLRRLGYVVIRHSGRLESTPYERTIKLDKHSARKKRKHERAKQATSEHVVSCRSANAETHSPSDADHGVENDACVQSVGFGVQETQSRKESLTNGKQEQRDRCKGDDTDVAHVDHLYKHSVSNGSLHHSLSEKCLSGADDQPADGAEPAAKRQRLEEVQEHSENLCKPDNTADVWTAATVKSHRTCLEFPSDSCRFSTWDFTQIRFPCIAGQNAVVVEVPAQHLLPHNVDVNEDFDDVCLFDVEDYKRQQMSSSCSSVDQTDNNYSHLQQLQFSYSLWLQKHWTQVQARNWGEWKREMAKRTDSLSLSSPVSHLWQGEVTPLLQPEDATSTHDVLSRLNIIQPFQGDLEVKERNPVKISFDVFLPNTTFKKTNPGVPDHRICVSRDLQPPGLSQVQAAKSHLADRVPLHWAVVSCGEISFFVFEDAELPLNPSPLG